MLPLPSGSVSDVHSVQEVLGSSPNDWDLQSRCVGGLVCGISAQYGSGENGCMWLTVRAHRQGGIAPGTASHRSLGTVLQGLSQDEG